MVKGEVAPAVVKGEVAPAVVKGEVSPAVVKGEVALGVLEEVPPKIVEFFCSGVEIITSQFILLELCSSLQLLPPPNWRRDNAAPKLA